MTTLPLRETYKMDGPDHVWVNRYFVSWPSGQTVSIDVPVPNPPEGKREHIRKQLETMTNNAIVRIGRKRGAKGKPSIRTERVRVHVTEVPGMTEERPQA